jgi:predicted ATPase|tara:strand:+ start:2127 stop:3275 length:1149 start_codon:yes stop_codon:yes gene_type:complete
MIKNIKIKNFKSFDDVQLELEYLNVLSGINGSGKSTICQALLLLQQYANNSKETISLNAEPLHLGKLNDIYYQNADSPVINIVVSNNSLEFGVQIDADQNKLVNDFANIEPIGSSKVAVSEELSDIVDSISSIRYLAAERQGPRAAQSIDHQTVRIEKHVGIYGQFTNSYLEFYGSESLDLKFRSHIDSPSEQLAIQVAYWLKEISPNINLTTKNHSETDQVSISYSFDVSLGKSDDVRPTNIGFGISYVLPVVVMCLSALPGETIIIDTPEAHLHPKGQFTMGELIACTAADGVQVIVETHSDHILNGIRVQTIKEILEPEQTKFYYFELGTGRSYAAPKTIIHNPIINSSGQFNHWPSGFFDEWSYALNEMLKLRGNNIS